MMKPTKVEAKVCLEDNQFHPMSYSQNNPTSPKQVAFKNEVAIFLFFRPFGLCPFRALLDQKPYNRRLDENLMNTGAPGRT
jgi:hypothetical protein